MALIDTLKILYIILSIIAFLIAIVLLLWFRIRKGSRPLRCLPPSFRKHQRDTLEFRSYSNRDSVFEALASGEVNVNCLSFTPPPRNYKVSKPAPIRLNSLRAAVRFVDPRFE